jgi:hypothetical protein
VGRKPVPAVPSGDDALASNPDMALSAW